MGIEKLVEQFSGDKAVIVHLNDVFSLPRYLMGMENLLMSIATQPELVQALVDLSVDVNLKMAREVAARGVKIVYTGDDYAYTRGPLMSPRHFRKLFYPGLKRVMGGFKELGLMVIKHTDGNLWPIIDMIIDSGIDCLDPIDPIAGMDIAEVKAKYGHRVAIKGNVDCAETLTFGTTEEVVEETKEAMRKGMPGGGFILSSGNSIHSCRQARELPGHAGNLEEISRLPDVSLDPGLTVFREPVGRFGCRTRGGLWTTGAIGTGEAHVEFEDTPDHGPAGGGSDRIAERAATARCAGESLDLAARSPAAVWTRCTGAMFEKEVEMDYLMGIDLGSTSLKAVIYDLDGNVAASGSQPTERYNPYPDHPEWTVWQPEQIWGGTAEAIKEAVSPTG